MIRTHQLRLLASLVLTGLISVGVPAAAGSAAAAPQVARITISSFMYHPDAMIVTAGERVVVVNRDGMRRGIPHSVTADDGSFDTGIFTTGTRSFVAPTVPGHYDYHCRVHAFMHGSIHVVSG